MEFMVERKDWGKEDLGLLSVGISAIAYFCPRCSTIGVWQISIFSESPLCSPAEIGKFAITRQTIESVFDTIV